MLNTLARRLHSPLLVALVVGLLAAVAAAGLIWRVEAYRLQEARATATNTASDYAASIERNLQQALTAANALAALVRQGKGSIPDFEGVAAEMLPLYPGVSELALAPGGIIRSVVPLAGNEKALGLDLLQNPAQKKESVLARDSKKLTLAGPVDLVQGGVGLVARMPVFLRDSVGKYYFWGFTLVVIPVSELLRVSKLPELVRQGYAHELWRMHPDAGTKQTIAAYSPAALIEPVVHSLQVPNSAWTLSVAPVRGWGDPLGLSLEIALGILFSLLLAYLSKLMVEAQVHADALEELVARRTAEVRAREADLTRAQSIARVGSWVLDLTDNELHFSPETYRILGISRGTPLNFNAMLRQTYPDDRDAVDRAWQGVLNGERCDIEYRFLVGAEIRWLRAQAELESTADGIPWRCAGTVEDISERRRAAEALRARELQLSTIHDNAYEIIIVVGVEPDDQFRFISVNRRFTEATGIGQDQVVGKLVQEIIPQPACALVLGKYREAIRNRQPAHWEEVSDYPAGKKAGEVTIAPVFDANGHCTQLIGTVHDITERKKVEDRNAYLNRVYAMLSGINTLIVRADDRDELFRDACRVAAEAGGFRIALIAIVDRSTMTIVPVASAGVDERFLTLLTDRFSVIENAPLGNPRMRRAIIEKATVVVNDLQGDPEVVFRQHYAEAGISSVAILPLIVSDEAVGVLVLYASESEFFHEEEMKLLSELAGDIAFAIDHIGKRERLDYLAYYDVLTGLANRTLFLDRVAQHMRSAVGGGHKLALFLIDLERFKNINDSLGRPAGDALLRQVAEWLTRNVGDASLLARVAADHFALVMPEVKQGGDLARLLEKWMEAFLEQPFRLNDAVFRISAKVGVALFPDDGADADTLFRNAEAALKKAKATGDRYLFYASKMNEAVAGQLTLENQLRQALDKEEFVLHYQPKVNLVSGKLTGAEALIRWNDPRTGLVPPGRFIPVLEETGLIYEVGRWALRQAIADYLRWRAAGLAAVRIAVNVSPLQLRNRGFIDEIKRKIDIDAHAATGLELEITESLIMEDVKHNIASLQAIRDMGVSIAIDDFGTGFSSLSYLARLPVDALKIDHSFVIDMTAGPEGLALVSTIINLAHSLKLKVVAEGVETEEQSRLLRLLGCDEMQGFLYGKPVPGEVFETKFLAPLSPG